MQLHKRLSTDQVKLILEWYDKKIISQAEAEARLGVKRRRLFTLLKLYRQGKLKEIIPKRKNTHRRIPVKIEGIIRNELIREKCIIDEKNMPVTTYNYTAVRDEVVKQTQVPISAQTVRNRARKWGYIVPVSSRSKRKHIRVVLTTATGLLLQHDSSHHLWSPLASSKWSLITTIDDYSRMILCAEFQEDETAFGHIQALEKVILTYGVGANYYTDNHSIFRYVGRMESYWQTPKVQAKDVKTQWERAGKEGKTVFRKFELPAPFSSAKDIFCLKEERIVNGYNSISWRNRFFNVPRHIPEGARVMLHILPLASHPELRIWHKGELVTSVLLRPTNK